MPLFIMRTNPPDSDGVTAATDGGGGGATGAGATTGAGGGTSVALRFFSSLYSALVRIPLCSSFNNKSSVVSAAAGWPATSNVPAIKVGQSASRTLLEFIVSPPYFILIWIW